MKYLTCYAPHSCALYLVLWVGGATVHQLKQLKFMLMEDGLGVHL